MERDREPLSRVIATGVVLLALGIGLAFWNASARRRGGAPPPVSLARAALVPVQGASLAVLDGGSDFGAGIFGGTRLSRENAALRARLAALAGYDESLRQLESDVDALRRLQGLPAVPGRRWVTADVRGYTPIENRITISAGARKGVRVGMPVVSADGLLGIVATVGGGDAQVTLVTAASTTLGAMAAGHNPPPAGLIRGESGSTLTLPFLDPNATVANGDLIVTSGYGELVPRGLVIGRVIQVDDNPELGARTAKVFPAAQIGRVREVRVLL